MDALSMATRVRQLYADTGYSSEDERTIIQDVVTDQLLCLPVSEWGAVILAALDRAYEEVEDREDFTRGLA